MEKKNGELKEALETFVSAVSHDLRTPLQIIHLSAALAMQDIPSDPKGDRLRDKILTIQRQADAMTRLLNILLDAEKISAGKLPIHKTEVDAASDILEVLNDFMPLASHRRIFLDAVIPERPCPAVYDKDRIRQVLSNLVSNAIRYARQDTVCILLTKKDGDNIRFEVCNVGDIIPEDKRELIFERFERGGNELYSSVASGLGLWIARWIVQEHGGKIWVEPTKDGNAFCFTIPRST